MKLSGIEELKSVEFSHSWLLSHHQLETAPRPGEVLNNAYRSLSQLAGPFADELAWRVTASEDGTVLTCIGKFFAVPFGADFAQMPKSNHT